MYQLRAEIYLADELVGRYSLTKQMASRPLGVSMLPSGGDEALGRLAGVSGLDAAPRQDDAAQDEPGDAPRRQRAPWGAHRGTASAACCR